MSKQNFLCIRRSQPGQLGKDQQPSPAQMEEMFAMFNAWKDKFQENIVDLGGKLGEGCVVTTDGTTDGPFVEVKEVVGGFMIISADSLEEATKIVQASPGVVGPGATVEVRAISTP